MHIAFNYEFAWHQVSNCIAYYISCMQAGNPSNDWESDIEGKPEGLVSKVVRRTAKVAAKLTKSVANDSGLLDDKWGDVVSCSTDLVEQQAAADPHASTKDRAKLAGRYIDVIADCIMC